MTRRRTVLIEAGSVVLRAFHALPQRLATSGGLPTNAVLGMARTIVRLRGGRAPAFGAMVLPDLGTHAAREPALAAQLEPIERLAAAFGLPIVRPAPHAARDVVAALTARAVAAGHEVIVAATDKRLAQLVSSEVRLFDPIKDVVYDAELVRKRWGVLPAQLADLVALVGEGEETPGVPGIGAKGAARLLARHGSLEAMLAAPDELEPRARKMLGEHRERALRSMAAARLRANVPLAVELDALALLPVDRARSDALLRELELYSLLSGDAGEEEAKAGGDHGVCDDPDALAAFLAGATGPVAVGLLLEHDHWLVGKLLGVGLGRADGAARYVPFGERTREAVARFLADPARPKVLHDARDAWAALARHGIDLSGVVADTGLASFLIDPARCMPHRLEQVVREYLHRTLADRRKLLGRGRGLRYADAPVDDVARFAGARAAAVASLWPVLEPALEAAGQTPFLRDVALPLATVLGRMQLDGVRIDPELLERCERDFEAEKVDVERRIYALAGRELNLGSPKQLGEVLFDELGLPVLKRTKTGYSTDADVLERLAPGHEIAALVLRQRFLAKLINTYTQVLRGSIHPRTGRVHSTFDQTMGISGRIISTDPDLQRTPIRTEEGRRIREAFVAAPGWMLVSADFSQIELRLLAHLSGDPRLTAAFQEGADVHRRTAAEIFGVTPEAVTAAQRETGKTVNFATLYGQGATALGRSLGIPRPEAKAIIERTFRAYAGVRAWIDRTIEDAHRRGGCVSLLGRPRPVPELSSADPTVRSYGERVAVNNTVQGSAADLSMLAMLAVTRRLEEDGLGGRLLLLVHDELLLEAPAGEVERTLPVMKAAMEGCHRLAVPLVVTTGTGPTWASAHG